MKSISMVTEKTFQKSVIAKFAKAGVFVCKVEAVGQRGFPDLLLIHNGQSVYLELKSPKGTGVLSPLQSRMQSALTAAGAWVENAQSLEKIDEILEKLLSL